MNIEIINVGTELLLGEIINTNATALLKMCRDLGFDVYHTTVVGDNPERLESCLADTFKRGADCVITTGGLGPTTDDLTKELSAKYFGQELVLWEEERKKVEEKCAFVSMSHDISDNNFKQAYFPANAYILENDSGTANGCIMFKDDKMIVNLPGPPLELNYVIEHSLKPYLLKYQKDKIYTYDYSTMFIGESKLAEILNDIIVQQDKVSVALYAGKETVRVRLAVKAHSQNEADNFMQDTKTRIEERIDSYIVKENLKETLIENMVPISLEYIGDFRLQDDFLQPFISNEPQIHITVTSTKHKLGEIITFTFDDYHFDVPSLYDSSLYYSKIEARFVAQLYKFIILKSKTHTL
ncbi:MAG: damage-inducible protein CinA [Erysipelotrichaceae bacterium]|nr:damage-inducible protein CinA [Erysipelotrichaceae bacterium]